MGSIQQLTEQRDRLKRLLEESEGSRKAQGEELRQKKDDAERLSASALKKAEELLKKVQEALNKDEAELSTKEIQVNQEPSPLQSVSFTGSDFRLEDYDTKKLSVTCAQYKDRFFKDKLAVSRGDNYYDYYSKVYAILIKDKYEKKENMKDLVQRFKVLRKRDTEGKTLEEKNNKILDAVRKMANISIDENIRIESFNEKLIPEFLNRVLKQRSANAFLFLVEDFEIESLRLEIKDLALNQIELKKIIYGTIGNAVNQATGALNNASRLERELDNIRTQRNAALNNVKKAEDRLAQAERSKQSNIKRENNDLVRKIYVDLMGKLKLAPYIKGNAEALEKSSSIEGASPENFTKVNDDITSVVVNRVNKLANIALDMLKMMGIDIQDLDLGNYEDIMKQMKQMRLLAKERAQANSQQATRPATLGIQDSANGLHGEQKPRALKRLQAIRPKREGNAIQDSANGLHGEQTDAANLETAQGTRQVNAQPANLGTAQPANLGTAQATRQVNAQAAMQGNVQGATKVNAQAAMQGNAQGAMQVNVQGATKVNQAARQVNQAAIRTSEQQENVVPLAIGLIQNNSKAKQRSELNARIKEAERATRAATEFAAVDSKNIEGAKAVVKAATDAAQILRGFQIDPRLQLSAYAAADAAEEAAKLLQKNIDSYKPNWPSLGRVNEYSLVKKANDAARAARKFVVDANNIEEANTIAQAAIDAANELNTITFATAEESEAQTAAKSAGEALFVAAQAAKAQAERQAAAKAQAAQAAAKEQAERQAAQAAAKAAAKAQAEAAKAQAAQAAAKEQAERQAAQAAAKAAAKAQAEAAKAQAAQAAAKEQAERQAAQAAAKAQAEAQAAAKAQAERQAAQAAAKAQAERQAAQAAAKQQAERQAAKAQAAKARTKWPKLNREPLNKTWPVRLTHNPQRNIKARNAHVKRMEYARDKASIESGMAKHFKPLAPRKPVAPFKGLDLTKANKILTNSRLNRKEKSRTSLPVVHHSPTRPQPSTTVVPKNAA